MQENVVINTNHSKNVDRKKELPHEDGWSDPMVCNSPFPQ